MGRAELPALPPKVPGLGTVACAIPTRSRALPVIAAGLEGEPSPLWPPFPLFPWAGAGDGAAALVSEPLG